MRFRPRFPFRRRHSLCYQLLFSICAPALLTGLSLQLAPAQALAAKPLLIYSIDVEGGQATLFVSPSGKSLLVDTGWPSVNSHSPDPYQKGLHDAGLPDQTGRDADRIQQAMRDAGISQIDHVLITHFHMDHVGGVVELARRVPIGEFLDHGVNREDSDVTRHDFAAYLKVTQGKTRRILHPGDTISIPGLSVVVLTADGEHVSAVPGINPTPNAYCGAEHKWPEDLSENARSIGILVRFGTFRVLDLGDLTGAKELALVCPMNPIGTVDLYMVTHHGFNQSNARSIVHAVRPRVAIMNNGAHKAGSPEAWQTVHDSPGLEDLWQLHTAEDSDAAHNSPADLIANPAGTAKDGAWLKVAASEDGSFSVTNSRTGQTKQYPHK
jgi:beta-lactamase superfamily II metal-dependent hydrolase